MLVGPIGGQRAIAVILNLPDPKEIFAFSCFTSSTLSRTKKEMVCIKDWRTHFESKFDATIQYSITIVPGFWSRPDLAQLWPQGFYMRLAQMNLKNGSGSGSEDF